LEHAVCHSARAEDLQSSHRPLRARRHQSNTYYDWLLDHAFVFVPAQAIVGQFIGTFQEFPPSQKAGSFSLDNVLDKMREGATGSH
jgi:hypothetical protein